LILITNYYFSIESVSGHQTSAQVGTGGQKIDDSGGTTGWAQNWKGQFI
jgi:hypothetical protein